MTGRAFMRDGIRLAGHNRGEGNPVIFQHGLGGDVNQVNEVFPLDQFRCLTLECRAHGGSEAGPVDQFSIANFADDVLAFADNCKLDRFAVGGISMGAAIALRLAVIAPERVSALILARPAWTWENAPENMRVFAELSGYLTRSDRAGFEATATARHFVEHAPDNYASLLGFFNKPDLPVVAQLIASIANSGPGITREQVATLRLPVLVMGTEIDLVHPLAHAATLAATISGARLVNLAPKATDRVKHALEFRTAVMSFLNQTGPTP